MMAVAALDPVFARIREALAPLAGPGRAAGEAISRDARRTRCLADLPLMTGLSRLGLGPGDSMAERVAIYESLGAIDANLAAALPGPVMTGFVVEALADRAQRAAFEALFTGAPRWSCFALTEAQCGTDAAAMTTRATRVDGGWRLDGRKYLVGQGATADLVVVFARTGPGPLGVEAFMLRPGEHPGFAARRLPLTGLQGTNLSELTLEAVMLDDAARLGRHLPAATRARLTVSATLDAMRPCLGAVALGHARGALDRAEADGIVARSWSRPHRRKLDALLNWGWQIAAARDAGTVLARDAGMMKQASVTAAEGILTRLFTAVPADALRDRPWLRRAWRDARAFEYMEGISAIHRINGAAEFRASGRICHV